MTVQSKKYTVDVPASGAFRLLVTGSFMRIVSCLGPVDVVTDSVNLESLGIGDGFKDMPFSFITLRDRSGSVNTVQLAVASEEFLNAPQVATSITANKNPQVAGILQTNPAIGVASGQLVAANANRQYLLIQNNSSTQTIWCRFGGTAAVVGAPCFRVGPGGEREFDSVGATQAIQAIADLAGASVTVVEG